MKKFFIGMLLLAGFVPLAHAENGRTGTFQQQLKTPIQKSIRVRKATQQKIEKWQDERRRLETRYDDLGEENRRLVARKSELEKSLAATRVRIANREEQLNQLSGLAGDMRPALDNILNHLKQVINADLPFLKNERRGRLEGVVKILDDPQVPVSEKFRKAMEALLVEVEYGNTVSVYRETISIEDKSILVNIFRLGRISLFFQTLDRKTTGHYDAVLQKWVRLPRSMNNELNNAFEIGAHQRPATIVALPVGRIVTK